MKCETLFSRCAAGAVALGLATLGSTAGQAAEGEPVYGGMKTRWAGAVDQALPHPEHPRPQMVRDGWVNLNGKWDYAIAAKESGKPGKWDGEILVPFAVESQLSGVQREVGAENRLWYKRTFTAPALPDGGRLLLHFGAGDWDCEVWINGKRVGALAKEDQSWYVVVDGAPWGTAFDMAWQPVFSSNGEHVAAKVEKNGKYTLALDGRMNSRMCDAVWDPVFNADGDKILFKSIQDGTYCRQVLTLDQFRQ